MANDTGIEWCDSTHNEWIGCTRVSPACDDCYAARSTPARTLKVMWGTGAARHRTSDHNRAQPLAWQRKAAEFYAQHQRRRRVFCSSLSDWLDNEVPTEWRVDLLDTIRKTPDLDWLLLSKRIGNWRALLTDASAMAALATGRERWPGLAEWICDWLDGKAPRNVWLGATVVNQEEADRDIPKLLRVPAAVWFLSMEPLLEHVIIPEVFMCPLYFDGKRTDYPDDAGLINWIIAGAESGPMARPAILQWFLSLRQQCRATDVAFHMKQLGSVVHDNGMSWPGGHWPAGTRREPLLRATEADPAFAIRLKATKGKDMTEWPEDLRVRDFPRTTP